MRISDWSSDVCSSDLVLPLTEAGGALEKIEWRMASRPNEITLYEIDARAGFDKPAKVTNVMIVRGLPGLVQQVQLSGLTPDQLRDGMRQQDRKSTRLNSSH